MKNSNSGGKRTMVKPVYRMRLLPVMMVLVFVLLVHSGSIAAEQKFLSAGLQPVASFEGGKLYAAGKFSVVELTGTYRQMGRQYGQLMRIPMHEMYQSVIRQYADNKIICSDIGLEEFSEKLFALYPKRFLEMAAGMSETSGLTLRQIAVLNEFFDYLLKSHVPVGLQHPGNCSAMMVWGAYSKDASLVMGRNFDFPAFFRTFSPYIAIVVYKPADAANGTAVITYAGQISSIQIFSDRGLILENNDGSSSGDPMRYFGSRMPFMIKDLSILQDSMSMASLEAALTTFRMPYPLIYNVAHPGGAATYEMTTGEAKKREGMDGLLIGTNHFLHPGWGKPSAQHQYILENSTMRYRHLDHLAQKHKGHLDPATMMKILDIPEEQGGATPKARSIYQFVAHPFTMQLWLKAPTYSDWTPVDLKALLNRNP